MFKKIQQYLLINQPLVWNTKVLQIATIAFVCHIIFFVIGYNYGALSFYESNKNYDYGLNDVTVIMTSIVISILLLIIWLVLYFKNNAFKSFYPKNSLSLFKEWILIFIISFLLTTFTLTFNFAQDFKVRSYFSEQETIKRCKTISSASIFYDGSYGGVEYEDSLGTELSKESKFITFQNRKYLYYSLINKQTESFTISDEVTDSLNTTKIKKLLVNNQKDSIKKILNDYLKIVNEHKLETNLDANKWLSIVYNYPEYETKYIVGKFEKEYYNNDLNTDNYSNNNNTEAVVGFASEQRSFDSINKYLKMDGKVKFLYNKHYVPADQISYNYNKISESYTSPKVNYQYIIANLYFAIGLSILIFSYRISSGRNWLITLVAMGVLQIILGICAVFTRGEFFYVGAFITLTIVLASHFFFKLTQNKNKGLSSISLIGLLWTYPAFFPLLILFVTQIIKYSVGYNEIEYGQQVVQFPKLYEISNMFDIIIGFNLIIIPIAMLFLTIQIKKWKGIAEN